MSLLPKGQRATDVKAQRTRVEELKFRLALTVRKYPVQLTLILSLAILTYPVFLLIQAQHELKDAQKRLTSATVLIQVSRRETISRACEEQNAKNKATSDALTKAAATDIKNAKTPAAKVEIARRRDVTLLLIDALAPHEDCDERVKRLAPDTNHPTSSTTPLPTPTKTPSPSPTTG